MEFIKKFYDKMILGGLLVVLICVMTIQSCSLKQTRADVEDADRVLDEEFSKDMVKPLDSSKLQIDIEKKDDQLWHPGYNDGTSSFQPGQYILSMHGEGCLVYEGDTENYFSGRSEIATVVIDREGEPGDEPGDGPISGDADNDRIPDDIEVENGLDPNNPLDASGDLDNDQFSNLEEYQAKTKIGNNKSRPLLITRARWMKTVVKHLPFRLRTVVPYPPEDKRSWEIHIDVDGKTRFHRLEETIKGTQYKIIGVHFEEKTVSQGGTKIKKNVSEIEIQKGDDEPIRMRMKQPVSEKDPKFQLGFFYKPYSKFLAEAGKPFDLVDSRRRKESYTIVDVGNKTLTVEGRQGRFEIARYSKKDKDTFLPKKTETLFQKYEQFRQPPANITFPPGTRPLRRNLPIN